MQSEKEKKEVSAPLGDGINEFVQRHRKPIFVGTGFILAALIGFIAALSILGMVRAKAISAVEELSSRYETLLPTITEEYSAVDADALLADLEAFAQKNSGYAAGKAWSIAADLHGQRKNWPGAEAAWELAAKTAAKTYLAPIAFFNAGAAAEEQGKTQEAIDYYTSSLAHSTEFPGAARAQFAIGRLQESLGNNDAAIEAYKAVIASWSYDQVWPSLAQSRIIALGE